MRYLAFYEIKGRKHIIFFLFTTQVKKSREQKEFYGQLFDWKLEDTPMEDMTYTMIKVGSGTGGGLMKNPMPDEGSAWMPYMNVTDIKDATRKAENLGGNVMKDVTEVKDMGWLSIIRDPTGAMFGMWEEKKKQ